LAAVTIVVLKGAGFRGDIKDGVAKPKIATTYPTPEKAPEIQAFDEKLILPTENVL
jgi:hypothetical protein